MNPIQILLTVALILSTASPISASQAKLCFTCHDQNKYIKAVTHQPVAAGECERCHNPHVAKYKGLLQKNIARLCLDCHGSIGSGEERSKIHKPVRDGQCLACHDPHGSAVKGLLREKDQGETCFKCHVDLNIKFTYTHLPFAKGDCSSCHQPHQSSRFQLLIAEPDDLCRTCHKGSLVESHKNFPVKPASCLSCHNPHGSSRKALIKDYLHEPFKTGCSDCHGKDGVKVGADKCLECHPEVRAEALAIHNHLTSPSGNSCINCHSPHAGDSDKLFKRKLEQNCRDCHSDTYNNYIEKTYRHPNSALCSDCHQVHGSNSLAMLKGGAIQVCSGCHKSQGQFTHPVGEGVFDPRTGVILTCVSCHYPHGTEFKFNLKLEGSKDLCVQCHRGY